MELETVELTVEEINLVEAYRQLSPADRELSLVILNRLNAGGEAEHVLFRNIQHGKNHNFQITNNTYNFQSARGE